MFITTFQVIKSISILIKRLWQFLSPLWKATMSSCWLSLAILLNITKCVTKIFFTSSSHCSSSSNHFQLQNENGTPAELPRSPTAKKLYRSEMIENVGTAWRPVNSVRISSWSEVIFFDGSRWLWCKFYFCPSVWLCASNIWWQICKREAISLKWLK